MKKFLLYLFIILFFYKTPNVFGASPFFTVDNIEIKGKKSSNDHREKYLQTAYKKGFQKLIFAIIRKQDQKELLSTDLKTIRTFVASYKILEEKIQEDHYHLKTTIRFNRKKIEKFFRQKNIPYSEIKNLDILVYPILIVDSKLQVLTKNSFFLEWNKEKSFENINFILPIENLDDIDLVKKNLLDLEESDLSQLTNNYDIKNNAIIIMRFNNSNLNTFLKTNLLGVKKVKKINFNLDGLDSADVRKSVILSLKSYIVEIWKDENLIDISTPSYLTLNANILDIGSLKKILDKINSVNQIDSHSVEKLDNKSAKIKIKFFGKIKSLKDSLQESGFKLEIVHDEWNLYLKI